MQAIAAFRHDGNRSVLELQNYLHELVLSKMTQIDWSTRIYTSISKDNSLWQLNLFYKSKMFPLTDILKSDNAYAFCMQAANSFAFSFNPNIAHEIGLSLKGYKTMSGYTINNPLLIDKATIYQGCLILLERDFINYKKMPTEMIAGNEDYESWIE